MAPTGRATARPRLMATFLREPAAVVLSVMHRAGVGRRLTNYGLHPLLRIARLAAPGRSGRIQGKELQVRGVGRVTFAAFLLMVVGTINIIYGIGALDDANIFVNDTRFILD